MELVITYLIYFEKHKKDSLTQIPRSHWYMPIPEVLPLQIANLVLVDQVSIIQCSPNT